MEVDLTVRWEQYHASAMECDKTVVFGAKARLSGQWVPDREVANYVAQHPDRLIGFMCLDPTQSGWRDEMEEGHKDLKLKGIKLLPMYAGFKPNDPKLDDLWRYAPKKVCLCYCTRVRHSSITPPWNALCLVCR